MRNALVVLICLIALPAAAQGLDAVRGDWNGRIAGQLPIIFHIGEGVTLDSPDQNAFGIPGALSGEDGRFTIAIPTAGASFDGELSEDGQALNGVFHQSGVDIPLNLRRGNEAAPAPVVPRPDILEPNEREVSLRNNGVQFYGTLREPPGASPAPSVLILAGSGPTDRNGNQASGAATSSTYRQLAAALDAQGIRTLRFDKRMVGKSTGPTPTPEDDLRFTDLVDDAAAWAEFLRDQPGVTCVIILGHSEGALIATMAAQKTETCGVIMAAGIGRGFGDLIREQLRNSSLPQADLTEAEMILAELEAGRTTPPPSSRALLALFRPSVQRYMISEMAIDPAAEAAAVEAPVLILQGDNDIQVTVEDSRLLAEAQPAATRIVVPGMNHGLRMVSRDRATNAAARTQSGLSIAEEAVDAIVQFVRAANQAN